MISNIRIKNFEGIKNEININLLASNKIKRTRNSFFQVEENKKILKDIAIIGKNGSGKSSIIHSLETILYFLIFPSRRTSLESEISSEFNDSNLSKILNKANKLTNNETTLLEIELFIKQREDNIPGVYTYSIMFDNNFKDEGIIQETLKYKKNYSSTKEILVINEKGIFESGVTTACIFKNNSLFKKNEYIDYIESFLDEILFYTIFNTFNPSTNLITFAEKNINLFKYICNIADEKIINVCIDKNDETPLLKYKISNDEYLTFNQLSKGTQKAIRFQMNILDAIINNKTIIIDEFENYFHFSLAKFLIFLNETRENSCSQIIFTTHSPLLAFSLDNDQIFYLNNDNFNIEINNIAYLISTGKINRDADFIKLFVNGKIFDNPLIPDINSFYKNHKEELDNLKN